MPHEEGNEHFSRAVCGHIVLGLCKALRIDGAEHADAASSHGIDGGQRPHGRSCHFGTAIGGRGTILAGHRWVVRGTVQENSSDVIEGRKYMLS